MFGKTEKQEITSKINKKGDVFSVLLCEPVKAKCSTENISPFAMILRPGYRNLSSYIDLTSGIIVFYILSGKNFCHFRNVHRVVILVLIPGTVD